MLFSRDPPTPSRLAIDRHYRADETASLTALLDSLDLDAAALGRIEARARALVEAARGHGRGAGGIDAFLQEYGLSTHEGVMLMCIAEALLRIPDGATRDKLIRDKLAPADWDRHLGHSRSLFVNASTLALMLTGRIVSLAGHDGGSAGGVALRLAARLGEPVLRAAVEQAMKILGRQFVMGRSIGEALERARSLEAKGYAYSYDMLGEAARTARDAERYFSAYGKAIAAIGAVSGGRGPISGPGISIKLSALHPRYEVAQRARVMAELSPRLAALARQAAGYDIGLTVDAEEAERLDLSLDLIEAVSGLPELAGWDGLGLAVQAYQKRAPHVIDWLAELAGRRGRRLMPRLVKGAYWDSEIKRAQELGLEGYPVFTRKAASDVSYLACARRLFAHGDRFFPQFATHNAHTLAAVLELAGQSRAFELQRLHGMGEALHRAIVEKSGLGIKSRIYAPVGRHQDLLPYLVRRLLENGANSSFVNRLQDEKQPIATIIADPIAAIRASRAMPHPRIPKPRGITLPERETAKGLDLSSQGTLIALREAMLKAEERPWRAGPIIDGSEAADGLLPVRSPADRRRVIGEARAATMAELERALALAVPAAAGWAAASADARAASLERAARAMEANMPRLMALAVREAGKTLPDAVAEVREAVDFCRYYAARARAELGEERMLAGGGVFACISPWNFPLAIFTGQIAAALAAGNAVIAKPAEQTPLIAAEAVRLLHKAGVPANALQLLPGDGETIGAALTADPRVAGVCFTGSTEVAQSINRTLARRADRHPVLVAETGGLNAMIVDSSALPEQVVRDVLTSAFQSAGQRCSALRVLFLQEGIADVVLAMLEGAMDELSIGDPALLSTDIGPVIDDAAKAGLEAHQERMRSEAREIKRLALGAETRHGSFVAPSAYALDSIGQLRREVFGPILHVVRYAADRLDQVVDAINATGYGLTLGIHSRIDASWRAVAARARTGNIYVNRNQIGALVGIQPFGGMGLSGTGPKAGGPHYLHRFMAMGQAAGHGTAAAASGLDRQGLAVALEGLKAGVVPPLAERAAMLEQVAAGLDEETGSLLRFFAAEARRLLEAPLPLPGPTGERNELGFVPRGLIACLGDDAGPLTAQIAAAFVTGNRVAAAGLAAETVTARFHAAGATSAQIAYLPPGTDAADLMAEAAIDGVAVAGPLANATTLAAQDGPIRPIIPFSRQGGGIGVPAAATSHYLHRFLLEKTISHDTTASGGNASLLALTD